MPSRVLGINGAFLGLMGLIATARAENGANAYLLSVGPTQRAQVLASAVGDRCVGKDTFYMGIGSSGFAKGKAFWSIRCIDKRSFAVQVNADGTSKVLECAVLEKLNGGQCFKKF